MKNYRKPSIDIIGEALAEMTFPMKIEEAVNNGDGKHTLIVCDIYHSQPGFKITIDNKIYKIVDIDYKTSKLIIKGDAANITATDFELYKPFFFHGTPIDTNIKLEQEHKAENKTPMLWMLENFKDRNHDDKEDEIDREIIVDFFFLTQADHAKWFSADAHHNAIQPMMRLAENFIEHLRSQPGKFKIIDFVWDSEYYSKFGVFIQNKGMQKRLWSDELAGVKLPTITIEYLKQYECNDC